MLRHAALMGIGLSGSRVAVSCLVQCEDVLVQQVLHDIDVLQPSLSLGVILRAGNTPFSSSTTCLARNPERATRGTVHPLCNHQVRRFCNAKELCLQGCPVTLPGS